MNRVPQLNPTANQHAGNRTNKIRMIEKLHSRVLIASTAAALLFAGCTVGPKYQKPTAQAPAAYKELTPADFSKTDGWKVAQPSDNVLHGKWWEMFNDPKLNALEDKINISNQNVQSAMASYMAARALVKEARSQYFPTVSVRSRDHVVATRRCGLASGDARDLDILQFAVRRNVGPRSLGQSSQSGSG